MRTRVEILFIIYWAKADLLAYALSAKEHSMSHISPIISAHSFGAP